MTRPRISYLWLAVLAILLAVTAWYAGRTYELQHQAAKAKAQALAEIIRSVQEYVVRKATSPVCPVVEAPIQPATKPAPKPQTCGQIMRVNRVAVCGDTSYDFRGQELLRMWRFGKLQGSHRRAR